MTQLNIFDKPKDGYSWKTSWPAYKEPGKEIQEAKILELIKQSADNLLHLSQLTKLPQSTVAGRVNDLIKKGLVEYSGTIIFEGRLRKKIKLK